MEAQTCADDEWVDRFGRRRASRQTSILDDGTQVHGAAAIAAADADLFGIVIDVEATAAPAPAPMVVRRAESSGRPRAAPRARRTRSTSADDDADPEPALTCVSCGRPHGLRRGARWCRECGTPAARKRAQRDRDRRAAVPPARFCRCGAGAGYEFDYKWFCALCGHPVRGATSPVNGRIAADETLEVLEEERDRGIRVLDERHVPWRLPRARRVPPWPTRTYYDVSIIVDPDREGVMLGA